MELVFLIMFIVFFILFLIVIISHFSGTEEAAVLYTPTRYLFWLIIIFGIFVILHYDSVWKLIGIN